MIGLYIFFGLIAPIFISSEVPHPSTLVNTTIKGILHIADSVELRIGIYQNPLVEYDPYPLYTWTNTSTESFECTFTLEAPEMIEFYVNDKHRYRFYIIPGSVNTIHVDEHSYTIEGPTTDENAILQQFGFNKAALKRPRFSNIRDLPLSLTELNRHCDSLDRLMVKDAFSDDFSKYITAEMFGYRYFWKSQLLHQHKDDTLGIDTLPVDVIRNIHSLFQFDMQDEVRSRYYLNAISSYNHSSLNLVLSKNEEANFALYSIAYLNTVQDKFKSYPALQNIFLTAAVNTAVYKAQTQDEIELAKYLWTYYSYHSVHQDKAYAVIKRELDRKVVRIQLNKLMDYSLVDAMDSLVSLSTLLMEGINIVAFWASWCSPCIEKMPELKVLAATHNINLVYINIWSSKSSWLKLFDPDIAPADRYLFADKEGSNQIAEHCSITQFPLYVLVDNNLNVVAVKESYSQLVDWASEK